MKEGDEVEIPILKTPIITWRYYPPKSPGTYCTVLGRQCWCLFACRYVKAYGTFTLSGASMYDAIDSNAGNYVRVA